MLLMATTSLPAGFSLRIATSADLPVLMNQREKMFRDIGHHDEATLAATMALDTPFFSQGLLDESYRAWLIVDDTGAAAAGGGIVLVRHHASPRDPHDRRPVVVNVFTEPPHRRRGLARLLMETMITWAKGEGFKLLYLHASPDGRALYEALGFEATNEMRLQLDREPRTLCVDDERWQRWQQWVRKIKDDLSDTINDQADFQLLLRVMRENSAWIDEHQGGWFCRFVGRCYVARTALGIRRHLKGQDDAISLVRLLSQMRDAAARLTYDFFLGRFPPDPTHPLPWQPVAFRRLSEDGKVVSARLIEEDINRLRTLAGSLEAFTDRALAHLDKKGFDGTLTLGDLENAVAAFNRAVCRYYNFLTGGGYDTLDATVSFNQEQVFRYPLVRPCE
jgi:GNAT superfamily N-acetyltransferase